MFYELTLEFAAYLLGHPVKEITISEVPSSIRRWYFMAEKYVIPKVLTHFFAWI